jgi:hypothetical protein
VIAEDNRTAKAGKTGEHEIDSSAVILASLLSFLLLSSSLWRRVETTQAAQNIT